MRQEHFLPPRPARPSDFTASTPQNALDEMGFILLFVRAFEMAVTAISNKAQADALSMLLFEIRARLEEVKTMLLAMQEAEGRA